MNSCAGETSTGSSRLPLVLLIEDSVTFREELRCAGIERLLGCDRRQRRRRVALAGQLQPDGIIIDGLLPGIDGITVTHRLAETRHCGIFRACCSRHRSIIAMNCAHSTRAMATPARRRAPKLLSVELRALLRSAVAAHSLLIAKFHAPGQSESSAVDDSPTFLDAVVRELQGEAIRGSS